MGTLMVPSVGRIVHFHEFPGKEPEAAIITRVSGSGPHAQCDLSVFRPGCMSVVCLFEVVQGDVNTPYRHWRQPPRVDAF